MDWKFGDYHTPKQTAAWLHTCQECQSVAVCRERAYARYLALSPGGDEADCYAGVVHAIMEMATIPHVILFVPEKAWDRLSCGVCPRNLKLRGLLGRCAQVRP